MSRIKLNLFESLSCRNFRLYFIGQCISLTGSWIQQVAMGWLVYRLTGSVALLGIIVFLSQAPTFIITPLVSSLIDRISQKKILVFTQVFFLIHALCLTILTLGKFLNAENVWIVLVLSLFFGIINALDQPTRQAFYISLVPKEMLTNAVALNSAIINGTRLIGPAIGGFLIVLIGEGGCFLVDTISYFFVNHCIINDTDTKKTSFQNTTQPIQRYNGRSFLYKSKYSNSSAFNYMFLV